VQLATALAISTGLSTLFIGLFIVAVGTSLPELAFELKAISSGQVKMALGDLLGSVVANSTLILGLAALIRPLTLSQDGLIPYGMAIGAFTLIYLAFVWFVKTKKKLEWWEGLLLLLGFAVFALAELSRQ
jgi:cation:H+ antiporter